MDRTGVGVYGMSKGVITLMIILLGACGSPGTDELLARAADAVEGGDMRAAIIDLRTAVAEDPSNAEARFRLGMLALQVDDAPTAEKELRRARELGYDDAAIVEPLCEAYLLLGRPSDLLAEAVRVSDPSAELLALAGDAYLQLKREDRALRAFQRALEKDETNERTLLGLARYAQYGGDAQTALERLEAAIAAHPDSAQVRLDYGRFLYLRGDYAEAEEQFSQGLALPSASYRLRHRWDLLVSRAEAQLGQSKLEEAEQSIAELNQLRTDHPVVEYLRARLAFERRDLLKANEYVGRALVSAPNFDPAQMLQGAIHLARGDFPQAQMFLQAVVNKNPNDAQARKLLAAAELGLQEQTDGEEAVPLDVPEIMSLLGEANATSGDYRAALALFERVLLDDPDNHKVRLDLIAGYVLGGSAERARELLDEAQWETEEQELRATILDTLLSLSQNDLAAAREKGAAGVQRFPDAAAMTGLSGLVEMAGGNEELARQIFSDTLAKHPSHTTSVVNLARLELRADREAAALELLETFLEANPEDSVALVTYAQLQSRSGDEDAAIASLERARAIDKNAVAPRQGLTRHYAQQGDFERAEIIARELVALRPSLASAHNSLGIAVSGLGRTEEGADSFRQAVRVGPGEIEPLRNLARAELLLGQVTLAQKTIDQLLRVEPDDPIGLELSARLALAQNRVDDAEETLVTLASILGEDAARIQGLRGDLASARGELDTAIRQYELAFAQRPASALVSRLYNARQRRGDSDARDTLDEWLATHPEDAPILLLSAQHSQREGDFDTAIETYEQVVKFDPNSALAYNNLAWLYGQDGDSRALSTAQRAVDLAPNSPQIKDTYGWLLVLDGQLDNGVSILTDAWESAPQLGDIGYHLAEGLARSGEPEQARVVLEQALAEGNQFASRAEAERLLGEL
jgi:putative PEP-CTERM system TPR-repeat lipoprotein